jgi:Protein of unknown function (DUF3710)
MFRKRGGPRHVRSADAPLSAALAQSMAGEADPVVPERGPYDVRQAPADVPRLDFGSLQIPAVEGVEVRVQANPDGAVEVIVLVDGESALQLGAFAAPRTEGIWDEVRREIATAMAADGVQPGEIDGPYGTELTARVQTPDGSADVRFVGVDGPRWMVRALYQGPAAADPGYSGVLAQCLEGLVVVRDEEARPPREPLPLRLPAEMAEQAREQAEAQAQAQAQARSEPGPVTNGRGPHA